MALDLNKVVIYHYNGKKPIICIVNNNKVDNFFSAELFDEMNPGIKKGDPIVVGALSNNNAKIFGGSVVSITSNSEDVNSMILVSDFKPVKLERRKHERLPTSLYGVVSIDNMVVSEVCIKDISHSGVRIYTQKMFEPGENIEIDIFFQNDIGHYNCSIVRNTQRYDKKEYGLDIIHDDDSTSSINTLIENIKDYYNNLTYELLMYEHEK